MSSRPSNFHPNTFSIGSMRLYVVHPVSLWNGTSSFPELGLVLSASACSLSASHGQTSPRGTPPRVVRSWGQMGARPETRTCQRAARGTRRVGPSAMDSDSRKSVDRALASQTMCRRKWMEELRRGGLTYHVAWPPLSSEKRWVALEGVAEVDQERGTTLEADHWVVRAYLHDLCCLHRGYLLEPLCFR